MTFNRKTMFSIITTFVVCLLIYFNWDKGAGLVNTIWQAAHPFFMGAGIAFVVNIVMTAYEGLFQKLMPNNKLKNLAGGLSLLLAYLTFIVVVTMLFAIVLPSLIGSLTSLLKVDPAAIKTFINDLEKNEWVSKGLAQFGNGEKLANLISGYSQQILSQVLSSLTGILSSVSSVASTLMNLFVSLIFSIYILSSKATLGKQAGLLIDTYFKKQAKTIYYVINILKSRFHGFFVSQSMEAVILGSLTGLGMLLLGLPYAMVNSVLIAFTAMIPIVGGLIGTAVGAILIMTQSFEQAVIFVIFCVVLQQFEGNVIYPRVVGGSIGLPGMWVLVSITLGGALGGILGMLVAVPLAASCYQVFKDYTYHKRQV